MRTRYLHTREKMNEAPAEFFVVHTDGIRKYGEVVKRAKKMTVDRPKHGKKRPSAACRRLDFGETEPSVLLSTPGESELFLLHGSFSVVEKKNPDCGHPEQTKDVLSLTPWKVAKGINVTRE